jgi:hypothetical protein
MSKAITFAFAVVLALTTWLAAERKQHPSTVLYMVTSFDFSAYPACRSGRGKNCIQGIRFYDADSGRRLADAAVSANTLGRRQIIATANVGSIPKGIYAVTAYLNASGESKEGRPGEISRFRDAAE